MLKGKKVAILTEEGFEQIELTEPREALKKAGAEVVIVSPNKNKTIKGWDHTKWGMRLAVDKKVADVKVGDFDALVIPGGVLNPDKLRRDENSVRFVKEFVKSGKPVASICHGPQMLIEAGVLKGKKLTSYPAIKTDMVNAGTKWEDKELMIDGNLITSRKPDDLPAFNQAIIDALK